MQAICHSTHFACPSFKPLLTLPKQCKEAVCFFHGRLISLKGPKKLLELSSRTWFIFKMNLHHLIPIAIAAAACFIPSIVPGGLPFSVAMISAVGSLSTAFSYYSYKLMESWSLYPYDYIEVMTPQKGVIERPDILEKIVYVLAKPEDNNVLLIGEPGTGKSTMAQALANYLSQDPDKLKGFKVLRLDLDRFYSVDQPFGHFEKRFLAVIELIKNENVILFIDELHRVFDPSIGSKLSDRLKSYPNLRIFGATNPEHYYNITINQDGKKELKLKDKAFDQRFKPVKIDEMNPALCKKILQKKFQGVDDSVLDCIIQSSKKLHPTRAQPRNALQLLVDERYRHADKTASQETVFETVSYLQETQKELLQAS